MAPRTPPWPHPSFHDDVQPIRALKEFLAAQNIQVRLPC